MCIKYHKNTGKGVIYVLQGISEAAKYTSSGTKVRRQWTYLWFNLFPHQVGTPRGTEGADGVEEGLEICPSNVSGPYWGRLLIQAQPLPCW